MHAYDAKLVDPSFYISDGFLPFLAQLRATEPVHWTQAWPTRGFWSLTRHEDVNGVLLNPLFSVEQVGTMLPTDPTSLDNIDRVTMGLGLVPTWTDPPRHDDVRRALGKPFSAPQVAKLTEKCRVLCNKLLDEVAAAGSCDFVQTAGKLSAQIICELMGVPEEDWELIGKYVNGYLLPLEPENQLGATPEETRAIAKRGQLEYVKELLRERRKNPRDDLATSVSSAKVADESIPDDELHWWCWAFLNAGFETSRSVMAGGLLALMEYPEQLQLLREQPQIGRQAAEELTRWVSPVPVVLRVPTKDTQIAGRQISAGEWVACWLSSANRDERAFLDPHRLDLQRKPNPHLGFGGGPHNCIGRSLGILEVHQMLVALLNRLTDIELSGSLEWAASTTVLGLKRMPIRFRTR